ncbi:hypothetical protein [Vogesella indigofera]|uniref:hypothetical protein n=1 Tax=Vogesella indigofera TaxID=45465 RepID=UPI00234CAF12|nr:hypothetical protein [Vogesella indigofera]MDC7703837.1 hypothetical protein [Vogesella indigofera]
MEHQSWATPWQTIQIDSNNAATHYLCDIIHQFEITLGIAHCNSNYTRPEVTIASNIVAGGNVEISNIHVGIERNDNFADLHTRAEIIDSYIEKSSKDKRLGIFILDTDNENSNQLSAFRSVLWNNRLEKRVPSGLLLIAFIKHHRDLPEWLPDADEVIDLPAIYSNESARNAIEDLSEFFILHQLLPTESEANAAARAMVASNSKPKELYANFAATLSNMEQWR